MARAFFKEGAFFKPGAFFQETPVAPEPPAIIELGAVGAAIHSLPFRALGGSVVDLDLLYGVLGHEATLDDIVPMWAVATRTGVIRVFAKEIPRQGILDVVAEAYTTLLEVEDLVIESAPAGNGLFGYVGLMTRPITSVRLSNTDGYWSAFVVRELLLNSPAALYVDIAQTVAARIHAGVVTDYDFDGDTFVVQYGFQTRRQTPVRGD